jgi:3-hydroxyacyl-[acyl-carrier-protein] dehydratase
VTRRRPPAPGALAGDFLPHTPPFLLLDRIVALDGARGVFVKGIGAEDPLVGPSGELSPLLLVEAMAQGSGIVLVHLDPALSEHSAMLAAVDHCEIAGTAAAGDSLEVEVTIVRRYSNMARARGVARVGDRICATASLTLALARAGKA